MTLSTKVRGFPVPQVMWKLNDEPINESDTAVIEFQKPMTYKLTLKDVPESLNDAIVTISANNVGGEAVSHSKLTVKGRAPQFISKPIKCTILEG